MTTTERPIHHTCPDCGYELAGTPTVGCPECGVHTHHAGRRRNMHRHAPPLVAAFALGALFAPFAGMLHPLLWFLFGPILIADLIALIAILRKPANLFWLEPHSRTMLTVFAYLQATLAVGVGLFMIVLIIRAIM
jgi:hypothetical protein